MQYRIINYSHQAVHYIPLTYVFYNWKRVPFDTLLPIRSPPPTSDIHQSVLCNNEFFFFFFSFKIQAEASGQANRPLSQKDWGCVKVSRVCVALGVVAF